MGPCSVFFDFRLLLLSLWTSLMSFFFFFFLKRNYLAAALSSCVKTGSYIEIIAFLICL